MERVIRASPPLKDEEWMARALEWAAQGAAKGEVPVGALVVVEHKLVSAAHNLRETTAVATHHAEILAIEDACRRLGAWRLTDATLFVTLEPCLMCSGAIINGRLRRVVYGAKDAKAGAVESIYSTLSDLRLNHRPEVLGGVLADQCSSILTEFFRNRRARV